MYINKLEEKYYMYNSFCIIIYFLLVDLKLKWCIFFFGCFVDVYYG